MTRVAWVNPCAGVAGDMLLAALVDAGADRVAVFDALGALGLDGYAVTFERVQRCGIGAVWANVVVDEHRHDAHDAPHDGDENGDGGQGHVGADGHAHGDGHGHAHGHGHGDEHPHKHGHGHGDGHPHRPAREVLELIAVAPLPPRVAARAMAVYRTLAEVEGAIHGLDPEEVELHEVGALDSILDVVGVCAALESLGVDRLVSGPIAVGHGTVRAAHGTLPNPAPAVVRLLARAGAPVVGIDTTMELATPTGVALLTELADGFGPMPSMSVASTGFGAGRADPTGRPNVVQVVIGELADPASAVAEPPGRPCRLVEANVDDATAEVLAHTVTRLLAAGAHDAWVTPIVMKKGRAAHTVHALCDEAVFAAVTAVLVSETGTLGLRAQTVERWPQRREEVVVEVDGEAVRVKLGRYRAKVEHDDAAAAAAALGLPLREVLARAERAALDRAVGDV